MSDFILLGDKLYVACHMVGFSLVEVGIVTFHHNMQCLPSISPHEKIFGRIKGFFRINFLQRIRLIINCLVSVDTCIVIDHDRHFFSG